MLGQPLQDAYLTGGPFSDRRLIDHQGDEVTFWARSRDKRSGNPSQAYTLTGAEFTCRWALHILPKGFVKSRCFGGFRCRNRKATLAFCKALLRGESLETEAAETDSQDTTDEQPPPPACPNCQTPMASISHVERPV